MKLPGTSLRVSWWFQVHAWDPRWAHGVNESDGSKLIDSSAQLQLALTQAGAAGPAGSPKVLQLERGWYAVVRPMPTYLLRKPLACQDLNLYDISATGGGTEGPT